MFQHYKTKLENERDDLLKTEAASAEAVKINEVLKLEPKRSTKKNEKEKTDADALKTDIFKAEALKAELSKNIEVESKRSTKRIEKAEAEAARSESIKETKSELLKRNMKLKNEVTSPPVQSGFPGFNFTSQKTLAKALSIKSTTSAVTSSLVQTAPPVPNIIATAGAATPPVPQKHTPDVSTVRVYGNMLPNRENESYKTFRFNIHDTCVTIIPEVLGKYKIASKDEVDWSMYALFLCFRGQELCLSFDQSPVEVALRHIPIDTIPEFIIKHIHIRDPFSPAGPPSISTATSIVHQNYLPINDDELKISLGDTVTISDRKLNWLMVELNGKKGWVPSSCVTESNTELNGREIYSTGVILADYEKNSANEISVKKNENIKTIRHFQNWFYVERSNVFGWIPSCYISLKEPINEHLFKHLLNQVLHLLTKD